MSLPRLKIGFDTANKMPVYITDRYIHILLMGKSGTGKSTAISNFWEVDDYYGNAKVLVDPSGFLSQDCFSIAKGKALYCSLEHPVSINPMVAPYTESQISDIVAEAVNQVIAITTTNQMFTSKMRDILDQSVKWCLRNNRKSLLHVLDHVKNMQGNNETRDGIISRLSFLLNDERMIKILCGNNSIEWGELIAKRQTFILSCFGMSSDKMVFAGSLVTNGINAYFRFATPKEYLPLSVYLDECHNFVTPSLVSCLKEARKYNLSICLSTQDFAVIEPSMTRVMLNVGNIVSYRLGYREASYVSKELDITPQELQFIEKYHVAYLTPKARGIAKAPRPPFFIPKEPPKVVAPQPKSSKPKWFTRTSYQKPDQP
jgi:hypothetical protein